MDYDVNKYLEFGEETARAAGRVLVDYIGKFHVHEKGRADLVTEADFMSQETVKSRITQAFPTHVLLGEENTPGSSAKGGKGVYRWIVDPLDGTTNYVHGDPRFCVSLALEYDGELQVGVIYSPLVEECYTATRGGGAFLNGRLIRTSGVNAMRESLIAVGFPPGVTFTSPDLHAFMNVLDQCHAIRRTGSTAMNLAYTAAGRYDATWNFRTNAWDIAAGTLLVREAGGTVEQIDGSAFDVDTGSFLAAATRPLYDAFLKRIHGDYFQQYLDHLT
ncbi:MAG: inositol monophosphatase family protein [Planctomycetia bacterium]|nr:inositol monophosphatase family protein [Planctomycetia bacterium]